MSVTPAIPMMRILEPSCGAGAFLLRAASLLGSLNPLNQEPEASDSDDLNENLNTLLFGVELDSAAAAMSFYQLASLSPAGTPHLWPGDFLETLPEGYEGFDLIIGNPPYVRQEYLAQQEGSAKLNCQERLMTLYAHYLDCFPGQKNLFKQTGDLYLWFFLKATLLLKSGGRLVFVTSNSWLNTAFGRSFQQFLHHHFRIHGVIESACEQWFASAAVNPVILVLERRAINSFEIDEEMPVAFVRLRKSLREILPAGDTNPAYWDEVSRICQQLLTPENLPWAQKRVYRQSELFSPAPVKSVAEFGAESGKVIRSNWAFYLRAPQVLDTVLHPAGQSSVGLWKTLQDLGKVRYPLKTGINQFFYVTPEVVERFGIESEFLYPVVKTSKMIRRYLMTPDLLELRLFSCTQSLDTLESEGKQGALDYIRWGATQTSLARQKRLQPVPWPEVASVQGRPYWYAVASLTPPDILSLRFFDRRYFFVVCEGALVEDQTFYGLTLNPAHAQDKTLVAALLNTTVSYLLLEFLGRTNLGDGVLQFALDDMMHLPVLNPNCLDGKIRGQVFEAFSSMMRREILPLEAELAQPDRVQLDLAVLASCVPCPETIRERLASDLLMRMEERCALSRNRQQNKIR